MKFVEGEVAVGGLERATFASAARAEATLPAQWNTAQAVVEDSGDGICYGLLILARS